MSAADIHARLRELGATVAVAESLTGGLLCAALTEAPGASAVMVGGMVVYATDAKHTLAGVDERLLADRGPVDAEVAVQLARGARCRLRATYGLGVTGVAGPEPQDGKPVGLVFAAVSGPGGDRVRELHLDGDRAAIQHGAVSACLDMLATVLGNSLTERL